MNFSRILKFTCSGALLAAGIYAYADGEVTLSDGTPKTWAEFIAAINDPTTVKGTLPAGADQAVLDAKAAVTAAEGVVTEKKNLVAEGSDLYTDSVNAAVRLNELLNGKKNADGEVVEQGLAQKEAALDQAKTDSVNAKDAMDTYLAGIVAAKKKAYDDAEADLAKWNTQMTELNNTLTNQTGESTALTGEIDDANTELSELQEQYDGLEKEVEQVPTTVITATWLEPIYNAAAKFKQAYGTGLRQQDPNALIYYEYFDQESTGIDDYKGAEELNLSFVPVEGLTSITAKNFYNTFGKSGGKPVTSIFVYLGEEYTDGYDGYMLVDNYSGANTNIITAAVSGVTDLANSPNYSKTTITYKTTYKNPEKEEELSNNIAAKKEDIAELRSKRQTVNGNITATRNSMTTTQGLIDDYTKVPAGSAPGTLTKQATLKKAWDDAAAGEFDSTVTESAEYKGYETEIETANGNIETLNSAIKTLNGQINAQQTAVETANAAIASARKDVTTAEAGVVTAEQKVTEEEGKLAQVQATADADEVKKYNSITLNSDVTSTEMIKNTYSGTIRGNGFIINAPQAGYVFEEFAGRLSNAAVNGKFTEFTGTNVKFTNVVRWDNSLTSNPGRYYDAEGVGTNYSSLGALGFDVRGSYGVDFSNKAIVAKADNSIVYSISVYDSPTQEPKPYYVTQNGTALTTLAKDGTTASVALGTNVFAKSATSDLKGINNVFYTDDNGKNVSDAVDITDRENFYCPEEITAETVTYSRTLSAGYNAVCLPFELSYGYSANIKGICDYDRVTPEKFWFTRINDDDVLPANTPALIIVEEGAEDVKFEDISNVVIAQTDKSQIVKADGNQPSTSQSYGIFKKAAPGQIKGESQINYIYGLNKGGKFQAGAADATFPAFRMVIGTEAPAASSAPSPMRAAGIVDEKGIGIRDQRGYDITEQMITTAIADVTADAAEFSIVGGQGEIVITSEANLGKVIVYSIDGKAVASANVAEGTTAVSVAHGLYIVMGQKVLVK